MRRRPWVGDGWPEDTERLRGSMSKLTCTCGHVISDVVCPNEVTGDVLSDKSAEAFHAAISSVVEDYLEHLQSGRVDQWRDRHFNEDYPTDLSGGEMIDDVLTSQLMSLTLAMLECDECGRLWIQTAPSVNE